MEDAEYARTERFYNLISNGVGEFVAESVRLHVERTKKAKDQDERLATLETEVARLTEDLDRVKGEKRKFQEELSTANKENERLTEANVKLEDALAAEEALSRHHAVNIDTARRAETLMLETVQMRDAQIEEQKAEIKGLQAENKKQAATIVEQTTEIVDLKVALEEERSAEIDVQQAMQQAMQQALQQVMQQTQRKRACLKAIET